MTSSTGVLLFILFTIMTSRELVHTLGSSSGPYLFITCPSLLIKNWRQKEGNVKSMYKKDSFYLSYILIVEKNIYLSEVPLDATARMWKKNKC